MYRRREVSRELQAFKQRSCRYARVRHTYTGPLYKENLFQSTFERNVNDFTLIVLY